MIGREQYPPLLTVAVDVGIGPAPVYRAVVERVTPTGRHVRVSQCRHLHRNKRKALECGDQLAILDGAPRL